MSNQSQIKGDANVVLQSIKLDNNSQININNIQPEDIITELKDWFASDFSEILNLMIITSNQNRIQALNDVNYELANPYYGESLSDWKPFGEENIAALIEEYARITTLDVQVQAYAVDSQEAITRERTMAYLKLTRGKVILITDALALTFPENRKAARIFDDHAIGGCLVLKPRVSDIDLQKKIDKLSNRTFRHLNIYLRDFPERGFIFVELDISNKNELFRRITNIGTAHLGIDVKTKKIRNFKGLNAL